MQKKHTNTSPKSKISNAEPHKKYIYQILQKCKMENHTQNQLLKNSEISNAELYTKDIYQLLREMLNAKKNTQNT